MEKALRELVRGIQASFYKYRKINPPSSNIFNTDRFTHARSRRIDIYRESLLQDYASSLNVG